jgi:hypothetical protein
MNCTLRGISIDSGEESDNADDSICFNLEFDSNEIDESDSHLRKHDEQRISRLHGVSIDSSEENENAENSIRFNLEFDLNENDKSDRHNQTHDEQRVSMD